jgi:hypothetical protein
MNPKTTAARTSSAANPIPIVFPDNAETAGLLVSGRTALVGAGLGDGAGAGVGAIAGADEGGAVAPCCQITVGGKGVPWALSGINL